MSVPDDYIKCWHCLFLFRINQPPNYENVRYYCHKLHRYVKPDKPNKGCVFAKHHAESLKEESCKSE